MALLTGEAEIAAAIDRLVAKIVEEFHPNEVILFGSRAREDNAYLSDVDLLIVLPDDHYSSWSGATIRQSLGARGIGLDIVAVSHSDMERRQPIWGTVHNAARREGRVLHAAR